MSSGQQDYSCNGYENPVPDYGGAMAQQTGNAYSNPTTGVSNTNASDAGQQAMNN